MVLVLASVCALAQTDRWQAVRYDKWRAGVQIPAAASKHSLPTQPEEATCDLYAVGVLACYVKITPTPDTELASTVIERAIQAEMKQSEKLGAVKRWEQNSKQGDLFKGFTGPTKLDGGDPLQAEISRIIGSDTGIECVSMAPLGDDTAPVIRIGVVGPAGKRNEVVATAKRMAALVTRYNTSPNTAVSAAEPKPAPEPWPTLKKGEIEIEGVVDSVAWDRRSIVLKAEFIKLPGQDRITLSPPRSKHVRLKSKQDWLAAGVRVILVGKNTGIGKPMTADLIEATKQPPNTQ